VSADEQAKPDGSSAHFCIGLPLKASQRRSGLFHMTATLRPEVMVYQEVINPIAAGGGPAFVVAFRSPEAAQTCVRDLMAQEHSANSPAS